MVKRRFSENEKRIINLLVEGLNNAEIGKTLKISRHTVKYYVSRVLKKLGAKDRTNLAYIVGYFKGQNML